MFSNNYGPRSHTNSNNDVGNLKFERKIIPYKQHGIQLLSYTRCIFIVSYKSTGTEHYTVHNIRRTLLLKEIRV